MFMFKCHINQAPAVCQDLFISNTSIHSYETRTRHHLHVPKAKLLVFNNSVRVKGVAIWNKMLALINVECSIGVFKNSVKRIAGGLLHLV